MAERRRWLAWLLPLGFLGAVVALACHQDPDFWRSPPALYHLAQEAAGQGQGPRALELARRAWTRDRGRADYGLLLGRLYLEAGRPREALEVAHQVAERDPQAPQAVLLEAQALNLLDRRPAALELLAAHLKDRDDPDLLAGAAALAAARPEDRELAVTYYQRLYKISPAPAVRRQLVELLLSLDRFAEALPLQEEEAAQFPENQEAQHRLALLYYWQRDYQAAGRIYQSLLKQYAEDATLRKEAAQTADAAQDTDKALANYLWLYGHYQGKREYAMALARLWARKGNHAEAAGVLAPLMQDQPEPDLRRW
jgi:tetratricopeptide (TPR) repeat protein